MPATSLQYETSVKTGKPSVQGAAAGHHIWPQTQAVFWILLAVIVGFYGNGKHDLVTVARHHPDVWREAYYVGMLGVGINIGVFLYLAFWKTSLAALDSAQPFEPGSSAAVHIGTAAGILATLALVSAFWPIWNVLTPVVMFIMFMGFLMTVQLVPSWGPCLKPHQQDTMKSD